MDPILAKTVRAYLLMADRAKAQGLQLAPGDFDQAIKTMTKGKYGLSDVNKYISSVDSGVGLRNVGRSLFQGGTFNWGDELVGLLPEALGGGKGAEEDMRTREALFHRAHPYIDDAGQIAGGLVPTLLLPGGGEMALGKAVLRGAARGRRGGRAGSRWRAPACTPDSAARAASA